MSDETTGRTKQAARSRAGDDQAGDNRAGDDAATLRRRAAQPGEAIEAGMERTKDGAELGPEEKRALQSVAHGGEGFPHAYASGASREPADPAGQGERRSEGDGASPAASAQASRKSPRARRQGF